MFQTRAASTIRKVDLSGRGMRLVGHWRPRLSGVEALDGLCSFERVLAKIGLEHGAVLADENAKDGRTGGR